VEDSGLRIEVDHTFDKGDAGAADGTARTPGTRADAV